MISDYKPIIRNFDEEFETVEIYFAHDIHKGDALHDSRKWDALKAEILKAPNRFVILCGDYCDFATAGSKGNIYEQSLSIQEQKQWFTEQLIELKDRVVAIVPGNHENNRITRSVGIYPAYDCAAVAGLESVYRQHFAVVDLGVGWIKKSQNKRIRYVGFVVHRMRDCKAYNGADFVDGIDFAAYGHDHDPKDHPRSKLVYDAHNKVISSKNVEIINSGAFLCYGGYAVEHGYRPPSSKCYKLILNGKSREITTVGFYA